MIDTYLLGESQVVAGLWEALHKLDRAFGIYFIVKCFPWLHIAKDTGSHGKLHRKQNRRAPRTWEGEAASTAEALPTGLLSGCPLSSQPWLPAQPTVTGTGPADGQTISTFLYPRSQTSFLLRFSRKFYSRRREG